MKVVIPLAGKGSRMRPHTHTKPKPLLPLAGKAVLDHIIDRISILQPNEYIFITGHLKEKIEQHIKKHKGAHNGVAARFFEQVHMDGTASAICLAAPFTESVLIAFSDCIFDADLSVVNDTTDDGILWAQEVENYQSFGVIVHDDNNHMTRIVEKPKEPISKLANIGLYYIKNFELFNEALDYVCKQAPGKAGEYWLTDAFQYMIDKGAKLRVERVEGWYDTGMPKTTLESNAILLAQHHEIKSELVNTIIHEPVFIDTECIIEDAIIGPNVSIAKGCVIQHSILTDSIIDEKSDIIGVTLDKSIIGSETSIVGEREKKPKATLLLGDHGNVFLH